MSCFEPPITSPWLLPTIPAVFNPLLSRWESFFSKVNNSKPEFATHICCAEPFCYSATVGEDDTTYLFYLFIYLFTVIYIAHFP